MEINSKPHFFYSIPRVEPTKAESIAMKGCVIGFYGGLIITIIFGIFKNVELLYPTMAWVIGISLAFFIILSQINERKYAKKRKQYITEFDKTERTLVINTVLLDHDEEDNKKWGCAFFIAVKNPNTQKIDVFLVLDFQQKHLEDCEKILKTYESAQVGFEVTMKLHPTDEDALCLVLYEETSPYLNLKK